MLQANKATVFTGFHKDTLEVRKMELDYYLMVFDKLSSISALLAGFASSALMIGIPRRDNPYLVTLFFAVNWFRTWSSLAGCDSNHYVHHVGARLRIER